MTDALSDALDPLAWTSCVERLLSVPDDEWVSFDQENARRLLRTGLLLLQCRKAEMHEGDAPGRIVERANCLMRCAEDLFQEIIAAVPAAIEGGPRACPWCKRELTQPAKVV